MLLPLLHPEFLHKDGEPQFVILPYEEYKAIEELLEDKEDETAFLKAKAEHAAGQTKSLRELEAELGAS